jgi:hypothetical protein
LISEGLSSCQTATLTFGLGKAKNVLSVNVIFSSGKEKMVENTAVNKVHLLKI